MLELLRTGTLRVEGRLLAASNATFYCSLTPTGGPGESDEMGAGAGDASPPAQAPVAAVYKPVRGERPLWDFPAGSLSDREVATYLVASAAGWSVVPPTVVRDGPLGPGMCQLWIGTDLDIHDDVGPEIDLVDIVPRGRVPSGWLPVFDAYDGDGDEVSLVHADVVPLRQLALLDVICNNADRKGGHVLRAGDGAVFGVDHGLCFHTDDKLRTVLWGWAGSPLTTRESSALDRLETALGVGGALRTELCGRLEAAEVEALLARVGKLRGAGVFPHPAGDHPAIPWPVF